MSHGSDQQHESISRRGWGLGIGLLTWALFALAQLGEDSPLARYLDQLEQKSLDARFQLREAVAPTKGDERIVILTQSQEGIDFFENYTLLNELSEEDSYDKNYPPPWPRTLHGFAARHARALGAKAVFFDFLFTGRTARDPDGFLGEDTQFADSAAAAGGVYQALQFEAPIDATGEEVEPESAVDELHDRLLDNLLERLPAERLTAAALPFQRPGVREFRRVQLPLPELVEAAAGLGAVGALAEADGVLRRAALLFAFRGLLYPAIAVRLAADLEAQGRIALAESGDELVLGDLHVPIADDGSLWINWRGIDPEWNTTYLTYGLHQIIEDFRRPLLYGQPSVLAPDLFADKIVLIGSSATGLHDLKATPLSNAFPGVEVHATVLDNILNQDFLRRPPGWLRQVGTLLLFLVAGQLLMRRHSAWAAFGIAAALLALTLGAGLGLFFAQSRWIDLVVPCSGLVLLFAEAQTVQYFTEGRQKRQIRSVFQRYLPPTVVNEVLKVPVDELKLGGDRLELTVSFSDIEGFTSISESLEPEQLVGMLNIYLSEMSDIISASGGTLDKYIGDCIMAFWGAPLPVEDGPVKACLAALENQARLAVLRRRFVDEGLPALRARIGINSGPMLVGNMGSNQHFAYTVMGDAVNLASRLEGANKQYGTYLMIGERTHELAGQALETRPLDLLTVKGKTRPVAVHELLAAAGELDESMKRVRELYMRGLDAYRTRDFGAALAAFDAALESKPGDGPSSTYRKRCAHYAESPPPDDWDGVFTMTTK